MPGTAIEVEGRLRFRFDARWRAFKWDDSPEYKEGLSRHRGTQAVDILAALDSSQLWLIEVKDPRGHRSEFRRKASELHEIVAEKARDTLAGAIWSLDRITGSDVKSFLRAWLAGRPEKVGVALWWEGAGAAEASACMTQLQSRLTWLKPRIVVTNRDLFPATQRRNVLVGIEVESMAGAPPRP